MGHLLHQRTGLRLLSGSSNCLHINSKCCRVAQTTITTMPMPTTTPTTTTEKQETIRAQISIGWLCNPEGATVRTSMWHQKTFRLCQAHRLVVPLERTLELWGYRQIHP